MSSRRFLILHGIENHRPPGHWQHWLAERLRTRGEQVLYPQLPEPDDPRPEAWHELLEAELAMLGDGERIVVCHSLGCTLWLAHAAGDAPGGAARALLVAPPAPEVIRRAAPAFAAPLPDRDAVLAAAPATEIVASDADPYNPPGAAATHGAPLGLPVRTVSGAGHFTPDDGFGAWPAVERWCTDGRW
jgi:predicted alpha/beta hydrolase family esterase